MKIIFVLWDGFIGGAERFTASLAAEVRAQGTAASILFVGKGQPLSTQLESDSVPFRALGYPRGSHVVRHPRLLARVIKEDGADVAVIGGFGYLGAMLRVGGFRGPVLGVEHGVLHQLSSMRLHRRALRRVDRALGATTHDAEIAVSRYMEILARNTLHGRRLVRISHGVASAGLDVHQIRVAGENLTVGYSGRLCDGKGVDVLLRAVALTRIDHDLPQPRLRIVGDGPSRASLEALARQLNVATRVEFLGWSDDVAGFWDGCDLAVTPASELAESFSMSTLEAMARGCATIVTDRGALPELVIAEKTGVVVPAGDAPALAQAINAYASSPDLARRHGDAAQSLARSRFSLAECARAYVRFATEILDARPDRRRKSALSARQVIG
jgi:glycosyltransferase involved in cell wall biosynthesis